MICQDYYTEILAPDSEFSGQSLSEIQKENGLKLKMNRYLLSAMFFSCVCCCFGMTPAQDSFPANLQKLQDAFSNGASIDSIEAGTTQILSKMPPGQEKTAVMLFHAQVLELQGNYPAARKILLEIETESDAPQTKWDLFLRIARLYQKENNFERSEWIYSKLQNLPGLTEEMKFSLRYAMGVSASLQGKKEKALEIYSDLLAEGEHLSLRERIALHCAAAEACRTVSAYAEEREWYGKILQFRNLPDADRFSALEKTAYSCADEENMKVQEVEQSFNLLINDVDVDVSTKIRLLKRLAEYRLKCGAPDRAIQEYNRLSGLRGLPTAELFASLMEKGAVYEQKKNYAAARREYERIVRDRRASIEDLVQALSASAEAWLAEKNRDAARMEYERILMLPDLTWEVDAEIRKKIADCLADPSAESGGKTLPAKD